MTDARETFVELADRACELLGIDRPTRDVELLQDLGEAARARGWMVILKWMPEGTRFIIEGSRSEYDAPHPDREAPADWKATAELYWIGRTREERYDKTRWGQHSGFGPDMPTALCRAIVNAPGEL